MDWKFNANITAKFKEELNTIFNELVKYYGTFNLDLYVKDSYVIMKINSEDIHEYTIPQYDFGKDLVGKFVYGDGAYGVCYRVAIESTKC